jgi:cytoskeleton protein RodZ
LIKAERPVNEVEKEVAGVDVSGESVSPGDTLRKLREKRNLSIADVAQHLKYGVRQIEALERDDFQNLPGMTFVRGMTRSYAKLLGSNPTQLLSELEQRRLPEQVTVDLRTTQIPFPDGSKRATRLYGVLSVLLVLMAAAIAYEWKIGGFLWMEADTSKGESRPAAIADVAVVIQPEPYDAVDREKAELSQSAGIGSLPIPTLPSPSTKDTVLFDAAGGTAKAGGSGKRIALQFDSESWVEIKQADGKILMSQLNPKGSRQLIEGTPPFVLIIGNAPNVRLLYNEMPVDLRPHFKVDVARIVLE